MAQHGKVSSGDSNWYLVGGHYGDNQVWTEEEYDAAREVVSHLTDGIRCLRDALEALPNTFDSSFVENVISDAEDMACWYDEAVGSAERI